METLVSLLASPGIIVGTVLGICMAALFHRLAPAGTDTVTPGATLAALCAGRGLAWELSVHGGAS